MKYGYRRSRSLNILSTPSLHYVRCFTENEGNTTKMSIIKKKN
jgi:hypothetical protein